MRATAERLSELLSGPPSRMLPNKLPPMPELERLAGRGLPLWDGSRPPWARVAMWLRPRRNRRAAAAAGFCASWATCRGSPVRLVTVKRGSSHTAIVREKTPPTSSTRATTSQTVCPSADLARSSTGLLVCPASLSPLVAASMMSARSSDMGFVHPELSTLKEMPWVGPDLSSGDFLGSMVPSGKLTMSRVPGLSSCCDTALSLNWKPDSSTRMLAIVTAASIRRTSAPGSPFPSWLGRGGRTLGKMTAEMEREVALTTQAGTRRRTSSAAPTATAAPGSTAACCSASSACVSSPSTGSCSRVNAQAFVISRVM
mmetsp:Transcript_2890/g.8449  ORF Transcript_2890/g.8449 Transcript_2890/m.8449 type:complete len:314 (+) Transcript_2890:2865-3806(+)